MEALSRHFGEIDIDHFVTAANAVCKRFNIYFAEPGCKAPDAFA